MVVASFAATIEVLSDPAGAEIILNHIRTGRFTPDTIGNLPNGEISISVLRDNYAFTEQIIIPSRDSITRISFHELSDFDTLAITADSLFGILQLPKTPVETPYLVNEIIEDRDNVILTSGIHHIQWDGGISYEPIDTMIEVRVARITTLDLPFMRRYGRVSVVAEPDSTAIYVDSTLWGIGSLRKPLPAGEHTLRYESQGWISEERSILLFPGYTLRDTVRLKKSPDSDNDGFHDSVDLCPDLVGVYEGCPTIQKRDELRRVGTHVFDQFRSAPFTIEVAPISLQIRYAHNKQFNEMISLFNDGVSLFNNYRGITLLNKAWISRGLFISSVDVGYSFAGLQYEKQWKVPLNDDSTKLLIYDDYSEDNPQLELFSVGFQLGIQLHGEIVSFAFMTGYLYEEIKLYNITSIDPISGKSSFISESTDNSSWNSTVRSSISLGSTPMVPRLYAEISFTPSTQSEMTGWTDVRFGVIIPWWKEKGE